MPGDYENKLKEFVEGKIFSRLSRPVRNRADAHCDACGSPEPRILFGLQENNSNRFFFVGAECMRRISQFGAVQRRFSKEDGRVAFEQEMTKRRHESHDAGIAHPCQEIQWGGFLPSGNGDKAHLKPLVALWETPESYLALVGISHQGTWIWGIAEASCFEEAWEVQGNRELVLNRVLRERSRAIRECVGLASEDASTQIKLLEEKRLDKPSGNGRPDWTRFWKTLRDMGLESNDVVSLIDGVTPRDWLTEHPDCSLDDLLETIKEKREAELAEYSTGYRADTAETASQNPGDVAQGVQQ
jgi:hypothetical protein